jgi:hypothetical protein
MSRLAHTTTHTGTTRGATVTVMTAAVLMLAAAALLLLSLDGSRVVSARPDAHRAATTKLNPIRHDETQQWRDLAASGALACLGERVASRATAAMNDSMRQAKTRALAQSADPRSATHAAARSSLVLFAGQSYDTACRDRIDAALESVYAAAMSRLGDRPPVWRGAVLGDLVAGQRFAHLPATVLRRCAAGCRISGGW